MSKTLIRGATVVNSKQSFAADVLLDVGVIQKVADGIEEPDAEIVDGTGKYLIPGVIDDQVHFRSPGLEHKEDFAHATRACAKGGVTSFLEMPNTNPTTTTVQRLHEKLDKASKECLVNYGFYMGATAENTEELKRAERTPGIKIFIGSSTGDLLVDEQEALEKIFAETTLPICAHCEDESTIRANQTRYAGSTDLSDHSRVRDENAAVIATRRAVDLAVRHRHHFHVLHVSTAAEIEIIDSGKPWVSAEVCPHHLFFNIDDYARLGSLVKMNPSIKTRSDNAALWQALCGGKIEVVATDHAPHTLQEKRQPYPDCPSGLPAVENSLALMLNQVNAGLCSIEQVVGWMCEAPARIWNLKNKGRVEVGFDADVVLVDLSLRQEVRNENQQAKCGWTPWDGQTLTGWAIRTWVNGNQVFRLQPDGTYWFANEPLGEEIHFDRN